MPKVMLIYEPIAIRDDVTVKTDGGALRSLSIAPTSIN